jgi:hypothetical protein
LLEDHVTSITVTTWADEATRTANSACLWVAEVTVDGRTYTARSRHGAPNELARQLVAAGLADRPMVIHYRGRAGTMTYRSFHASATWTYSEGDQPLRRVTYKERPEGLFLGSGTGKKCVSSPVGRAFAPLPADYGLIAGSPAEFGRSLRARSRESAYLARADIRASGTRPCSGTGEPRTRPRSCSMIS